jgi:hypothetical protein
VEARQLGGLRPQRPTLLKGAGEEAGNQVPRARVRKRIGPTPYRAECVTLFSILTRNQVGRHWVYSGHYPRIFVTPKNAQNPETKHWTGAVPVPLLALSASTTSAYTSLGFLQELNPQPQLLKASVYHSATSAGLLVCQKSLKSINDALACYSYHNPNTLAYSETRDMLEQ